MPQQIPLTYYANTLKRLFHEGKLTLETAHFLHRRGYAVICGDGGVVEIIKEDAP